jgi:23S rRNA pseudouridine1911/1915/1917 synthase
VSEHRTLAVPEGLDGDRLDTALARLLGLSRTRAAELVDDGNVTLDGTAPARSVRVRAGDWLDVRVPPPAVEAGVVPARVEGLRIVHDDDDLVVVDKPVGVAAHPSPGWTGPTVLGHLAAAGILVAPVGAAERHGIVHRLDAGTSGLMVVAKSAPAYSALKNAFKQRAVDKTYHALVQGHPDPLRGTVDAPISRHPRHDHRWAVVSGGKDSVTHYETLEAHRWASLLEIRLETGRTHQIRVHMAALHHPCVGDLSYGADPVLAERLGLTRQWLHAVRLGFQHPGSGLAVTYESDYPDDLATALRRVQEP